MTMQECVVLSTCPNSDVSRRLAGRLVQEGLAACVNVIPGVESHYLWKGQVECEAEHLLLIKTHQARLDALEAVIREEVPYEVPELIAVPLVAGSEDYLSWMRENIGISRGNKS